MSSSDDDTTAPWVSIAKQPDWQDLEPIEQPVSLSPVVAIKYTTRVKELYSYFRAIRATKELSSRALWLTQEVSDISAKCSIKLCIAGFESCPCLQLTAVLTMQVIYVNSADYTAWAYRWHCLESLGNLDDEMAFIKEMASRSPKNYQLWNHRRKFAIKRGASYAQEVTQSSSKQTPG